MEKKHDLRNVERQILHLQPKLYPSTPSKQKPKQKYAKFQTSYLILKKSKPDIIVHRSLLKPHRYKLVLNRESTLFIEYAILKDDFPIP